ncbi:MAG: DUF1501 domain-containing protein [Planctomycetes bacterium]|nr:DUF1501 domain-containing protein [Planctomycetota bacterium]
MNLISRREALLRSGVGFGSMALASLVTNESNAFDKKTDPLFPKSSHFLPKAKHVVHLFMNGGPSQVDTFDPKPLLDKYHGKALPETNLRTERKTGAAMRSPFKFKKHGQSRIEVSELFENTAMHVDDMCIIRSMHADVPNHEPSLMLMNCGDGRLPRPSFGAWVTYGLGSENNNLPGFVVMCPGGYPIVTTQNWRSGFLPGVYQGTYLDTKNSDPDKLVSFIRNSEMSYDRQRKQLDLVQLLNQQNLSSRNFDPQLESRIRAFELAFRMQSEATDTFDLTKETKSIRELYGDTTNGRQLLYTRRLIEKGVRFIQVWSGAGQPWDNHDSLEKQHKKLAGDWDKPIAAFLADLKQRGLFESTLVLWGGEFGRTPVAEMPGLSGRDHNHYGFTCWLAGGGVKGGAVVGSTDEFGFKAEQNPVHVHDLHATMLHLLGMDHEKLTYRYAGRDFRLTDVHGNIINEIIA